MIKTEIIDDSINNSYEQQPKADFCAISKIVLKAFVYAFLILSPSISCFIAFKHVGGSANQYFPIFSDQVNYYTLVRSMLSGGLKGYTGYQGTHATIGNFGAHGFFILLPYYLFGLVFGWTYSSPIYASVLFLTLSIMIVLLLIKPSIFQSLCLTVFIIFNALIMIFISDFMMEILNASLVLVIAAVYIRFISQTETRGIKIFGGVILAFAILCRISNAIFVFPYVFYVLKNIKKRILFSSIITLVAFIVGYLSFSLFGAPFVFSQISIYLDILKDHGLGVLIKTAFKNYFDGFSLLIDLCFDYNSIFISFLILPVFYLGLIVLSRFVTRLRALTKQLIPVILITVLLQFLYHSSIFVLYHNKDAYIRMAFAITFFVCCFTILSYKKPFAFVTSLRQNLKAENISKEDNNNSYPKSKVIKETLFKQSLSAVQCMILCIVLLISLFSFPAAEQVSLKTMSRVDTTGDTTAYVERLNISLTEIMDKPQNDNKWENTVAYFFPGNNVVVEILAIPSYYNVNYYIPMPGDTDEIIQKQILELKAKYIIVNPVYSNSFVDRREMFDNNLYLLMEESFFILYINPFYIND